MSLVLWKTSADLGRWPKRSQIRRKAKRKQGITFRKPLLMRQFPIQCEIQCQDIYSRFSQQPQNRRLGKLRD